MNSIAIYICTIYTRVGLLLFFDSCLVSVKIVYFPDVGIIYNLCIWTVSIFLTLLYECVWFNLFSLILGFPYLPFTSLTMSKVRIFINQRYSFNDLGLFNLSKSFFKTIHLISFFLGRDPSPALFTCVCVCVGVCVICNMRL